LALATLAGCATPSQKFDRRASDLGFLRHNVRGTEFEHAIYRSSGPRSGPLLHVYLEGDASPRMASRYWPADPTPHRPQMLALMALDPAPSLLLGRPCQHGLNPDCDPTLWTIGRYGESVVASLVAALRRELRAMGVSGTPPSGVVLVGYSGGATLALLMAERLTETRAVITLAGNLDTKSWTDHHGYVPLLLSLNPAERPPLDPSVIQIHLLGGRDERVPAFLTQPAIARQEGAKLLEYPEFDHECCWASIWPETLTDLTVLLGEPLGR